MPGPEREDAIHRASVEAAKASAVLTFDLAALTSTGATLESIRKEHPAWWAMVEHLNAALDRIDELNAEVDHRAAPTDAV
ncbi:hypothetical protein [Arthrobacter sp. KBS0703]|uniref:hypothetical protein n=1 Tax=Arthrobacter sp. KBS0703 TaxID=1955698 RepID=UPI0009C6341B|nr:hypothetical protein [Arthrobacter sp. KBS0703]